MSPIGIEDLGRGPELVGTRITVFDILPYLDAGWHPSSIALLFGLSSAQVLAAIQYIDENKAAVTATQQKILERIARGNPPEVEAKRAASHARLMALRAELARKRKQEAENAGAPQ